MSDSIQSLYESFPDELMFILSEYLYPSDYFNLIYTNTHIHTLLNHEKILQTVFENAYPQLYLYLTSGVWKFNSVQCKIFMSIMNDSLCHDSNHMLINKISQKMSTHSFSANFQTACVYILRRLWFHHFSDEKLKSERQSNNYSSEKTILKCISFGLKHFKYNTSYIASALCAVGNLSVIPSEVIKTFIKKYGIKRVFKLMSHHVKDEDVIYYSLFMLRNLALIDTKNMYKIRKYHKYLARILMYTDSPKNLRSIMHLLSVVTKNYTVYSYKTLISLINSSHDLILKYSDNTDLIVSTLYVLRNLCDYSSCSYYLLNKNINLEFISKLMASKSCLSFDIECICLLISLYHSFPTNKLPQTHISALHTICDITYQKLDHYSSSDKFHDFCVNLIYVYLFSEFSLSNFIKQHPLLTHVKTYFTTHTPSSHIAVKWEHILSDINPINFI